MCHHFHDAAGLAEIIHFSSESTEKSARILIEGDAGIILVLEREGIIVGTVVAILQPAVMNHHHLMGQELCWWIEPEYRGMGKALLEALEERVKDMGAVTLDMIALESMRPKAVGAAYRRAGYQPLENHWVKEL